MDYFKINLKPITLILSGFYVSTVSSIKCWMQLHGRIFLYEQKETKATKQNKKSMKL